jgi:hypothetical protein
MPVQSTRAQDRRHGLTSVDLVCADARLSFAMTLRAPPVDSIHSSGTHSSPVSDLSHAMQHIVLMCTHSLHSAQSVTHEVRAHLH